MKAFLLAAGFGTRLRPITNRIPKCLVPIQGKPLLYYWLRLFERAGIDDVLINLHHLSDLVLQYLREQEFDLNIHTVYEEELLGSAGTIRNNFDFVSKEREFLICYSDNLTDMELGRMVEYHRSGSSVLTLGLFHSDNPSQCGIAELDEHNNVVNFVEKPKHPQTDFAGAGIYVASHEIWHYLPERYPADIGYDVLPQLIGKMRGYLIDDFFIDIGTIENYNRANLEFRQQQADNDNRQAGSNF